MCWNIVHSTWRAFVRKKPVWWLRGEETTNHGCALSTFQNVENKATENTLEMANLHQPHHQAKLRRTSELGRCLLSINLVEVVVNYTLKLCEYWRKSVLKIPIYIGIHIQTDYYFGSFSGKYTTVLLILIIPHRFFFLISVNLENLVGLIYVICFWQRFNLADLW